MLRLIASSFLLLLVSGCHSMDDYVHPEPIIDPTALEVRLPAGGVALSYVDDSKALPIVEGALGESPARVLFATRRSRNSIALEKVPASASVEGEVILPMLQDGEIAPVTRQVYRVKNVKLGDAHIGSMLMVAEGLPAGIDAIINARSIKEAVITFDGPKRELRIRHGGLPKPADRGSDTVRLELPLIMGEGSAKSSRFWASISVIAAVELDGPLMVGPSSSRVMDTHRGPELLPVGLDALRSHFAGEREVCMDDIFGRDFDDAQATIVDDLGSGWLVLGAEQLARHVLEIDTTWRLARLTL